VAGTRTRIPQLRQRTVCPRAVCGTDNTLRHFKFGQISRTTLELMVRSG
jgi:hypothetical protein